jgi:glutamyl-tRNA reductase
MGEKKQMNQTAATSVSATDSPANNSRMQIVNARVTYRNAPIHLLEKFTFKDMDLAHKEFMKAGFKECVILQTCNRVEVYASTGESTQCGIDELWARAAELSPSEKAAIEIEQGNDAVVHLMKLASGLDSLVIGEDQILGQVRRAFEYSKSNRYVGPSLSVAFNKALKVGGNVRTVTGINKGNVSIASIAVNLAEEYFDDLKEKDIMLIGTGEAASLVAKVLKKRGANFMVTSRAPERAKSFAETVAGTPIPFDTALDMLSKTDIVFTATKAPYRLVTFDRVKDAMQDRKGGMMIFDLSNPRTVDDRVISIHGVKLVNMDQIAELVGKNMRSRIKEVRAAEKLIEDELKSVDSKMKRLKAEPVVVSVFKSVDAIRERELRKAISMMGRKIGAEEAKVVEQLSHALVEGVLAAPMNNLRKEIENAEGEELMKLVAKLFKYEEKQTRQD